MEDSLSHLLYTNISNKNKEIFKNFRTIKIKKKKRKKRNRRVFDVI